MKSIILYFIIFIFSFLFLIQTKDTWLSFSLLFYIIGSIFCFYTQLNKIFYIQFGEKKIENKILFDILKTNHKIIPIHQYCISCEYLQFLFFTITYLYLITEHKNKIKYLFFFAIFCYFCVSLLILLFFKKYTFDFMLDYILLFYIFFGICIGFLFYHLFLFFIKQYFNKTIINKNNLKKDDDYYNISNPF
jgi:hypothetical protein